MAEMQTIKHPKNKDGISYDVPRKCPHCNNYVMPEVVHFTTSTAYWTHRHTHFLMLSAPCCNTPYFCIYAVTDKHTVHLLTYPKNYAVFLPDELSSFSPGFDTLYRQSYEAEENGAFALAACGYRNALQVLVVDYAIKMNNKTDEQLRNNSGNYKFLRDLIDEEIDNTALKKGSKKINLLGNSATHDPLRFSTAEFQAMKKYMNMFIIFISSHVGLEGG